MLEVKAFSEGVRQQEDIGTTFSNAVEGYREGQEIAAKGADIENQQQMNAQNEITLQKQQEALQYYPQQLAIENAQRQIDFANKNIGVDEAVIQGMFSAKDATEIMNVTRAARAQSEQFLQADPVQQASLLSSPDFARTVAQSPALQKSILPNINQEIQRREAAGDLVGVKTLTALYGHGVIPGVYEPAISKGSGIKSATQLKYEKETQDKLDNEDYKRGAALLSPEELQNAQTQGTAGIIELGRNARLKEQGNGDANLANPTQSAVPSSNVSVPSVADPSTNPNNAAPSTDPTVTPTESPNPENADTVVDVAPKVGADASGASTVVRQSTKPKNAPTYKPNPNYSTLADITASQNAELQAAGEIPGTDSYKSALKTAQSPAIASLTLKAKEVEKLDSTRQKREQFYNQMQPLIAKIEANPAAVELLGKAMEGGRDLEGALTWLRGTAGVGSESKEVFNLFAQLKGMASQGLMDSGLGATQLNTEGEIRFWMSAGFNTDFDIETLKEKLNLIKTNLHETEIASSAYNFALRNKNPDARIPALVNDYKKYEAVKGLSTEERKAKGLPAIAPDEAQLEGVMSPDEFFNARANAEHAKRKDATVEILQRKQRELNDTSRIDAHQSPINGVEDTDMSKLKFAPEHQEHAKVLARIDPIAYHDLYVQNSKGNAQMAAFGSAAEIFQTATKLDELKAKGILNRDNLGALDKAGIKIDLTTSAFQAPELLRIVAIESNGSSKAKSPKKNSADMGYEGIGQLGKRAIIDGFQDFTLVHKGRDADHLTIEDITDIRGNKTSSLIAMSAFLNGRWSKEYPDKVARLAYYNGGAPQANAYMKRKNLNDIPSEETREYLQLVVGKDYFTPKSIPTVQNVDSQSNEEAKNALATTPENEMGDTVLGRFNQAQSTAPTIKEDENLSPHDQLVKNKREAKQAPNPLDAIYGQSNEELMDPENPIYKNALLPDPRNIQFPVSTEADQRKEATKIATERMVEELMKQGHEHPVATFATSAVLSALNMAALGGGDKFLAALVSKGDLLHPGDYQQSYNMIKEMHELYNTTSLSGYVGARVGDIAGLAISTPGLLVAGAKTIAQGAMTLGAKIAPEITAEVASGAAQIAKIGIQYLNKHGATGVARLFENLTIGATKTAAQKEIIKRTMMDKAKTVGKGTVGGAAAGAASAEPGQEAGGAAVGAGLGAGLGVAVEAVPAAIDFVKNLGSRTAPSTIAKDAERLGIGSATLEDVTKGIEPGSLPSDIGDNRIGAMAAKANEAAVASDDIAKTAADRLASQGQEGVDVVTEAAKRAPEQIMKEADDAVKILTDEIKTKLPDVENATQILESGGDEAIKLLSEATGIDYAAAKNPYQVQKAVNEKFAPLYEPFKKMPVDEAQIAMVAGEHPILPDVLDKVNAGKLPKNLKELLTVQKSLEEIRSNRWGGNAATIIPAEQADEALQGVEKLIRKVDPEGLSEKVSNQYRVQMQADARYNKILSSTAPASELTIEKATQTESRLGKGQAKEIGLSETKIKEISDKRKEAEKALRQSEVLTKTADKLESKGADKTTDLSKVLTKNSQSSREIRKALDEVGVEYGSKVESQKGLNALATLNKKLSSTSKTSAVDVGKVIKDLSEEDSTAIKKIIGDDAFEGMQTAAEHLSNRAKTNQLLAAPGTKINVNTGEKLQWQLLSNPVTAKFYSLSALIKDVAVSPKAKKELAEAFFSGDVDKMKTTWESATKILKKREDNTKLQNLFNSIIGDLSARGVQTFLGSDKKKSQ